MKSTLADLLCDLKTLYGTQQGSRVYTGILKRIDRFHKSGERQRPLDEKDIFLITYGDQFREARVPGEAPLKTLDVFCRKWLKDCINSIHILPFYPYSSDDGFSVLDYHEVDPNLGSWEEVHQIGRQFHLMFDMVINHISAGSSWFKGFLAGEKPYRDFFITPPAEADLRAVIRPRTSPLLTSFQTSEGEQLVWTTFSADQVDLNFQNPRVMLAAVDVVLDYAAHGAGYFRLDAIAFLWKEFGSECLNLPQTHLLIQIIRRVLDLSAPHIRLITETNIPHRQNISYFGDGRNEAQMVYNFALPPLVLHALISRQVDKLRDWAATLATPSDRTFFFNFLASHDGIGINPARGILSDEEITELVETVKHRGGLVSYKTMPDGSSLPYELNINYFDALSDPESGEALETQVKRFLVSQAVLLAFKGVPAIYVHSLLGSRGWLEGPARTGQNRTINRQKFEVSQLEADLENPASLRSQVFNGYEKMLKARRSQVAFSPAAGQSILSTGSSVFSLLRRTKENDQAVLCCHNFSIQTQSFELLAEGQDFLSGRLVDLIEGRPTTIMGGRIELQPYQVLWLVKQHN
ncbi:MAG: alpha-amylase family glycosyl hydrolase [Anaerolineaceae bacterium]